MKKKKQQTRNLIILAVVTVGIILGLWAMNSNFSLNSKASEKCPGGVFGIGPGNKCYELAAKSCGSTCCNKKVNYSKCKKSTNSLYYNPNPKTTPIPEQLPSCSDKNGIWKAVKKCSLLNDSSYIYRQINMPLSDSSNNKGKICCEKIRSDDY